MPRVRSFNVFDTVLTRAVGGPESFLAFVAQRISTQHGLPPDLVLDARVRAERRLTERHERCPGVSEIWASAAGALNQPDGVAARWVEIDEASATELTVPVPGAAAMLETARRETQSLVFIANSPYSAAFVRGLLGGHGLWQVGDQVFTSSDERTSISPGALHRRIGARSPSGHDFVHTSEDRHDVAAARLAGWAAVYDPWPALTRYERSLEARASSTDRLSSWLAGSSRLARLEAGLSGVAAPIGAVSSAVMSSLLVGYALWLAGQAKRDGIDRLYFVARDGKVMMRVAEPLLRVVAPDLELRYLYASRQPWTLTASATSEEIRRAWITVKPGFTARALLSRVEITLEDAFSATGLDLFRPERADQPLTAAERTTAVDALESEPLAHLVREAATAAAEVTRAYLQQEGFLDGKRSALVDAGWTGRTSAAFDHILEQMGAAPVTHFLIGLTSTARGPMGARVVPWLFDKDRRAGEMTGFYNEYVLIGMFCAGLEGRTIGYRTKGDRSEPVFAASRNEEPLQWGLGRAQEVAVHVAELTAPHLTESAIHIDSRPFVWDLLRRFWLHPTREEVDAWGSYPYEQDTWPPFHPIAQRVTTAQVIREVHSGNRRIRSSHSWRAATETLSTQPWRTVLALRTWHDANRARLNGFRTRVRFELALRRGPRTDSTDPR